MDGERKIERGGMVEESKGDGQTDRQGDRRDKAVARPTDERVFSSPELFSSSFLSFEVAD